MARPSNTEERRAQIVEGLLTVIAEQGYERASVNSIAKAAGLSSGLIHYHFGSKQQILVALVEQLMKTGRTRYEQRMDGAKADAGARLDAFIDAHLALDESADARAVAAWVVIGAEALRQPEIALVYRSAVEERLETLQGLVSECLRENSGSARGAKPISATILATIEGAFQFASTVPAAMPEGQAAPTVRRMARSLVGYGS